MFKPLLLFYTHKFARSLYDTRMTRKLLPINVIGGRFFLETNIFQTRNFTPVFHQNNIDIKIQKRYNYVNKDKLFPGFFVTSMRKYSAALQVKALFLYLNKFAAVCRVFSDNYIANDIK